MYASILVPVDLDEPNSWQSAVPTALAMAKCFGAKVGLVYVVSDLVLAGEAEWSGLALRRVLDTARARLGHLADKLGAGAEIDAHVATGKVYRGVIDTAEEIRADLVVMASPRPRMQDALFGKNASQVLRHTGCSVLVVRE